MFKSKLQTVFALFILFVGLIVTVVVGMNAYVRFTAVPLHPDAQAVPSRPAAGAAAGSTATVDQARQIARAAVSEQNLPGLSIAVGVGGDIVWAEGFGWANIESGTPVTPAMRFRTGDVSKALTSAAVGLLLEQNKLNLDDAIQIYVPTFPEKKWPVKLRHLMGHVAGIRDDAGDEAPLANVVNDQGTPNKRCARAVDGLDMFATEPLRFEPGTEYRSSSFSWTLVSAAVETAAGTPFFDYMRTAVFEPLRMTATRPDNASEQMADRPTFYFPRFGGDTKLGPQLAREGDHSCYAGGGAFLSTPSDLVRFGMAINGGRLLKPETVQLLQTSLRLPSGEETGYGLGWKTETHPLGGQPARMVGHGTKADFIGGTTYLMAFPDRDITVAVMTNTSFADMETVALKLADAFASQAKRPAAK